MAVGFNGPQTGGAPIVPMPGAGGASNGTVPTTAVSNPGTAVNPTLATQNNPYAPPTALPGTPTLGPGSVPGSTVQGNGVNWADGSFSATGDLKDTYGAGTGTAISGVLQNMGTSNDAAIQALTNQTNVAAGKQYGNIQAQQAASGITPNSSTSALAAGDFYGDVNTALQSNIATMEQNQENTLLNTLIGTGTAHGPDETGFQSAMDIMSPITSILGSGANAASSAISGSNAGADTGWLDMLGALAV